jgi:NIPSNAP
VDKLIRFLSLTIILFCFSIITMAQASTPAQPTVSPSPSLAKDSRCYEIRTYIAAPGKLEELHARFRNHTMKIFKRHGIEVVGFWGPTDKEKGSDNTLIYVLVFPNRDARDQAWKNFGADPEWQAARKESEKNGKLAEKIESVILMSTDYAPVK